MAAPLFVLVRVDERARWSCVAGPVDRAGADDAVTTVLASRPRASVVVAAAMRSFTATVTTTEDPVVTVTP